jgi:hypothetical protein
MATFFITQQTSPQLATQHQANIAATLAHRLEKARMAQNLQLVALLEQEQRQLQAPVAQRFWEASGQWLTNLGTQLVQAIAHPAELSIERIIGDSGEVLLRAYDPETGETRYAETENEIVDWIETSRARGITPGILGLWGWQHSVLKCDRING